MAYKGGVPVNSGFYPRNNFPIAEAKDIYVSEEQRLDEVLRDLALKAGDANNADTVDGLHASDFASAEDFAEAQNEIDELKTLVGDVSVSAQINDAVSEKSKVQITTDNVEEFLSTLNIHKLTQEEYDQALAAGTLDENTLYLTPDEEIDISKYATKDELASKADKTHNHDNVYYTEAEVDTALGNKADKEHNHDEAYDIKGSADTALTSSKSYTDTQIANFVGDVKVSDQISDAVKGFATEKFVTDSIEASLGGNEVDLSGYATVDYVDTAIAEKSQVQIFTWEDDD